MGGWKVRSPRQYHNSILTNMNRHAREQEAEWDIRSHLWGYPALVDRFIDDVRPALTRAREERRLEKEKAEHEDKASSQIDINSRRHISNDENQDNHEAIPFSRQTPSSPLASPELTPEAPDVTEANAHQNSQAHSVDHSPSSDSIPLPTASKDGEVLEPTTGVATEQLDVSVVKERPDQQNDIAENPTEIQEIPSASENITAGSCILQSKEGSAE